MCFGKKYISKHKLLLLGIHPPKPWWVLYPESPSVMLTVLTNSPSTCPLDVPWWLMPHQGSSLQSANLIKSTRYACKIYLLGKHTSLNWNLECRFFWRGQKTIEQKNPWSKAHKNQETSCSHKTRYMHDSNWATILHFYDKYMYHTGSSFMQNLTNIFMLL